MRRKSPTKLSLENLSDRGYRAEVVEQNLRHVYRKRDLFGVLDILGINKETGMTIGVQTTDLTNVSHRIKKIQQSGMMETFDACKWEIEVHGWDTQTKDSLPRKRVVRLSKT